MNPTQFFTFNSTTSRRVWLLSTSSRQISSLLFMFILLTGCDVNPINEDTETDAAQVEAIFQGRIDLNNLLNYENQPIPNYINNDNTGANNITDMGATLGRVLFYDKQLSVDNTISCASCHQQANAFGDPVAGSQGVNGFTQRQSMRLVNARFADEDDFFWDERANSLEAQTTQPIQDHIEMGFSGINGNPDIDDLTTRLGSLGYYIELFSVTFGDPEVTEGRIQQALAPFIRSIQSFDSKYDIGRSQANNDNQTFANFTAQENLGKSLFNNNPQFQGDSGNRIGGGLGCERCHRAPEFDISPNSDNNGVISSTSNSGQVDFDITRSPSLRDLFNTAGDLNTPLMHSGDFATIDQVIDHYNDISTAGNNNLDNRLSRGGGVNLNITQNEREALVAFLKTLSGSAMYQDERWSDPFE